MPTITKQVETLAASSPLQRPVLHRDGRLTIYRPKSLFCRHCDGTGYDWHGYEEEIGEIAPDVCAHCGGSGRSK